MKRVQLQLPYAVVEWIDHNADGIESRASFVRRTLVQVMRSERCNHPGHHDPQPFTTPDHRC